MAEQLLSWLWLVGAVTAFVALELARGRCVRWWRCRTNRRQLRRAREGEVVAEALLEDLGYRVVERQPRQAFSLDVDGNPHSVEIRADLLVELRGRRFIAEVKTGSLAPRIETKATRRQLLEYRVAYQDIDGVLLVDADSREVHEIGFPVQTELRQWSAVGWAFIVGGLAGAVVGAVTVWSFRGWL